MLHGLDQAAADTNNEHAARTDDLTLYTVAARRDVQAMHEAGVLPLAAYRRRHGDLISAGWPANPEHHRGGRGKTRRPKHVNLLDRLDTHRGEVLRYAHNLNVPFTTNGSEQDVRPLKIRLKIAGCLRTMSGAEAFCRLRSYLSTAQTRPVHVRRHAPAPRAHPLDPSNPHHPG